MCGNVLEGSGNYYIVITYGNFVISDRNAIFTIGFLGGYYPIQRKSSVWFSGKSDYIFLKRSFTANFNGPTRHIRVNRNRVNWLEGGSYCDLRHAFFYVKIMRIGLTRSYID